MKTTLLALLIALISGTHAMAQMADDYGTATNSRAGYCPNLSITMQRGSTDATTQGQASQLQRFLIERGYLDIEAPTGRVAGLTVQAIKDFQIDNNLPSYGIAGSLTRAVIARVCSGNVTTSTTNTTYQSGSSQSGAPVIISTNARAAGNFEMDANGDGTFIGTNLIGGNTFTPRVTMAGVDVPVTSATYDRITIRVPASFVPGFTYMTTITTDRGQSNGVPIKILSTLTTTNTTYVSAPTLNVTLSPSYIQRGAATYLSWNAANATSCSGRNITSGASETLTTWGTKTLYPVQTTTYRVECMNTQGQVVSVDKTVTVESTATTNTTTNTSTNTGVPIIGFSASSYSITAGQSTQIAWNTTGADTCTLYYGGNTEKNLTQGLYTVYPTQTTTYRIVCANNSYSAEKSITVNVTSASTTGSRNIVDGNGQASCNATIVSIYGSQVASCSLGGGCGGLNPGLWGACINSTPATSVAAAAPTQTQLTVTPTSLSTTQNFTVTWSANNSPTSYNVKVGGTIYPQTGTSWTGTPASLGLSAGSHLIQVQACNIVGCSTYSAAATITVTEPATRNFVNGNGQVACNADIVSAYGSQVASCSLGGGCGGVNPGLWGACVTR